MASTTSPLDEEEETTTAVPSSPTSTRSPSRRPISTLTLPHESMESFPRTTTTGAAANAGTPLGDYPSSTNTTTHPFSAFYSHPQCITSCELPRLSFSPETDLEKGLSGGGGGGADLTQQASCSRPSLHQQPSIATTTTQTTARSSLSPPSKQSLSKCQDASYLSVWPTCSEVQQRRKDLRRAKGCYFFRTLTRTQKIIAKVCLAFLVLSIVTVLAVVISYKTGGLVWKSSNSYGTIGR